MGAKAAIYSEAPASNTSSKQQPRNRAAQFKTPFLERDPVRGGSFAERVEAFHP